MALLDALRNPLGKVELKWQEPPQYRNRLRGDVHWRLLIALGVWLGCSAALLVAFSFNVNPPGAGLAFGLGLIGFGIAVLVLFLRAEHVAGKFEIRQHGIAWRATSAGFLTMQNQVLDCEFDEISRCTLFPAERIGHSFSVMVLNISGDHLLFGIPAKLDYREVGQSLKRHGVEVAAGKTVPRHHREGLNPAAGIGFPAAGLAAVIVALLFFGPAGEDGGNRPQFADRGGQADRASLPDAFNFGNRPESDAASSAGNATPTTEPPQPRTDRASLPSPFVSKSAAPARSADKGTTVADKAGGVREFGELIGGSGGVPFERVEGGRPVLGIACTLGSWAGQQRIGQVQAVFSRATPPTLPESSVARPDYAVGGLLVQGDTYVDAIAVLFCRLQSDGRLDPSDSYTGEWLGRHDPSVPVRKVQTDDQPVVGLRGRGAAVLDAIVVLIAN